MADLALAAELAEAEEEAAGLADAATATAAPASGGDTSAANGGGTCTEEAAGLADAHASGCGARSSPKNAEAAPENLKVTSYIAGEDRTFDRPLSAYAAWAVQFHVVAAGNRADSDRATDLEMYSKDRGCSLRGARDEDDVKVRCMLLYVHV